MYEQGVLTRARYTHRPLSGIGLGDGCIEEGCEHREQPVGAIENPYVGRAGKDGQLGGRKARDVAEHAAAAQSEHLDGVLGADAIGVPDDDQGGRGDRLDGFGGPGERGAVELSQLGD